VGSGRWGGALCRRRAGDADRQKQHCGKARSLNGSLDHRAKIAAARRAAKAKPADSQNDLFVDRRALALAPCHQRGDLARPLMVLAAQRRDDAAAVRAPRFLAQLELACSRATGMAKPTMPRTIPLT